MTQVFLFSKIRLTIPLLCTFSKHESLGMPELNRSVLTGFVFCGIALTSVKTVKYGDSFIVLVYRKLLERDSSVTNMSGSESYLSYWFRFSATSGGQPDNENNPNESPLNMTLLMLNVTSFELGR